MSLLMSFEPADWILLLIGAVVLFGVIPELLRQLEKAYPRTHLFVNVVLARGTRLAFNKALIVFCDEQIRHAVVLPKFRRYMWHLGFNRPRFAYRVALLEWRLLGYRGARP